MGVTAGWAQAEGNQRKWNDNAAEYIINLESAYNFPPELIRGGPREELGGGGAAEGGNNACWF